jgi:hypothetical protein
MRKPGGSVVASAAERESPSAPRDRRAPGKVGTDGLGSRRSKAAIIAVVPRLEPRPIGRA